MKPYFVSFFGHREVRAHRTIEERLTQLLRELARTKEYVEIYIGRSGEFDTFATSVVKCVMREYGYDNIGMTLVIPYANKDLEYYETYYDSVMIPESIAGSHPKGAITKRNRWMIEESDLIICFCEREEGGAYSAMKYAGKLGKQIINIAESEEAYESDFLAIGSTFFE